MHIKYKYWNHFSQAILNCILPAEFHSFTAPAADGKIYLQWNVSEVLKRINQDFVVQRSSDGITFETICTVNGEENSNYNTADNLPQAEFSHYRIQQVDCNDESSIAK